MLSALKHPTRQQKLVPLNSNPMQGSVFPWRSFFFPLPLFSFSCTLNGQVFSSHIDLEVFWLAHRPHLEMNVFYWCFDLFLMLFYWQVFLGNDPNLCSAFIYTRDALIGNKRLGEGCVAGRLWFGNCTNRYGTYSLLLSRKQLKKYHFFESCLITLHQNNWTIKGNAEDKREKIWQILVWLWHLLTVLQISE